MTERIDHAERARHTMRQTLDCCETDENTGALVSMAAAQVHATLALVEQQRIANLIALNQCEDGNGWQAEGQHDGIYEHVETGQFSGDNGTRVRPEIKEALGL